MFTWLPMNHLPQVPDHLVQVAENLIQQNPSGDGEYFVKNVKDLEQYWKRRLTGDGRDLPSRTQRSLPMPQEWHTWVQQNIVKEYIETSVRVSEGQGNIHGAHCDFRRKWKLYYLLNRGGDDATTCFYQQKGHNAVRDEITNNDTSMISVNNYDELTVIDRVKWPMRRWVLLNTMVLHGVEGVTGPRNNLTISIAPDFDLIFPKGIYDK